jgi:hypothetical protein
MYGEDRNDARYTSVCQYFGREGDIVIEAAQIQLEYGVTGSGAQKNCRSLSALIEHPTARFGDEVVVVIVPVVNQHPKAPHVSDNASWDRL